MKKTKIVIRVLVLCLGLYVLYSGGIRIAEEWKIWFLQSVQKKVEKQYMAGLMYKKEAKIPLSYKIMTKAADLFPLGSYIEGKAVYKMETEDDLTCDLILENKPLEQTVEETPVQQPVKEEQAEESPPIQTISKESLKDFNNLISSFYVVDSSTYIEEGEINAETMLSFDMKIQKETEGPKILIYHTHSQEAFVDSIPGDVNTTVIGVGRKLTKLLTETYGIETLHHEGIYDMENGHVDRSRAYERAKPQIQKILDENPSIEVVIDLHRDGVNENTHLVTEVDGKPTAKIMFFNGLSRTRSNGNVIQLQNPYIQDNLALSLQMKVAAEEMYPGFTRKIYLKGYRYNMHFKPKTLLIEGGAQTNTVEEIMNAMDPLAKILARVLSE